MFYKRCLFIIFIFGTSLTYAQKNSFQLHSHNDYEQEFPLSTAMTHNVKSIEIDVFEYQGKIVVSHDDDDLHLKPTIEDLYLEPLTQYSFEKNQSIYLLVDLKMDGHLLLNTLHNTLKPYHALLKNRNTIHQNAPIQIVLSGSVDKEYVMSNNSFSYFFIDGRIDDLQHYYESDIMPIISANIEDLYCWKANKRIQKSKLKPILEVVDKVHEQKKLLRFWNTADEPELWDLLIGMKVDIIGMDDIEKFIQYASKFDTPD